MEIRRLRSVDDRSGFRSGNVDLDRFFQLYAGQNQFRHHIGTTYIAVEGESLLGFVTVSPAQLDAEDAGKAAKNRLPHYPLPVLRMARLAVDASAQGRGVGHTLLRHVFALAWRLAEDYGCVGVVVDAKPEAATFYEKLGFEPLDLVEGRIESRPQPTAMFLPLGSIPPAE